MENDILDIPPQQEFDEGETICIEERIEYYIIPHRHHFYEIVYILEGAGFHIIDGHPYNVTAGDMLFIDYKQPHIVKGDPSFKLINIMFLPEFISEELADSETMNDFSPFLLPYELRNNFDFSIPVAHFRGKERKEMDAMAHIMFREYENKNPGFLTILKAYMQVLFCMYARNIQSQKSRTSRTVKNRIPKEIFDYIDINCFTKINLNDLAEKYFYSPSYFSHLFKETCGKSLSEYIKEKRIAEAVRLLTESNMSITDICKTVGYQNRKLFNKFFKQTTGITPTEYRSKYNASAIPEFCD